MQFSSAQKQLAGDGTLEAKLELVRKRRVFFAHQSVGANLLDGLSRLSSAAPRLVESTAVEPLPQGTWRHARLGTNGAPQSKLQQLCELMDAGMAEQVDLVLFKLCYVDVGARTDVEQLHAEISSALNNLRRRHPRTRFVPMTVPLTAVQTGMRAQLKRWMGRPPGGALENARRHALNRRLRGDGRPVFDLARLEAQEASGKPTGIQLGWEHIPALAPGNTVDGGHLNPEASLRIARELVEFLVGLR